MMKAFQSNSYLFGGNAPYVEELYESYLNNPGSVPERWREYFDNLQHLPAVDGTNSRDIPHMPVINAFAELKATGVSILLVEQNFNFAQKIGDTVAVMDNGVVVHSGRMQALTEDAALQKSMLGLAI